MTMSGYQPRSFVIVGLDVSASSRMYRSLRGNSGDSYGSFGGMKALAQSVDRRAS